MLFVGVNNNCKNAVNVYVGVNGIPKQVSHMYIGESDLIKRVYHKKLVETIMTSSGTLIVPPGVYRIHAFCVGGGAGGENAWDEIYTFGSEVYDIKSAGKGGGGGYTKTKVLEVKPGDTIHVTIGAGGEGGSRDYKLVDKGNRSYYNIKPKEGGVSSVISGPSSMSADGGKIYDISTNEIDGVDYDGAHGGSGGGAGYYSSSNNYGSFYYNMDSFGGTDGSDGGTASYNSDKGEGYVIGGKGQGTTTRAFGEEYGTLYSRGGNGGNNDRLGIGGSITGSNTGDGGSGANYYNTSSEEYVGGDGGSGIVILRW